MDFLIDTHVLIWFGEDSTRLPQTVRQLLMSGGHRVFVSPASIWEMAIKGSLGKLTLKMPLAGWERLLAENHFTLLPATFRHFEALGALPFHHQDPFDRLMIAQAMVEGLTVLTFDRKFLEYPVAVRPF